MRTALFVVLLSLVPLAAAAPEPLCSAGLVCVAESSAGENCDDFGGGATQLIVAGGQVVAGGSYDCYPGGGGSDVYAYNPAANVYWGEFHFSDAKNGDYQGCFIFVGPLYSALPCTVGAPPNPGWGDLLP